MVCSHINLSLEKQLKGLFSTKKRQNKTHNCKAVGFILNYKRSIAAFLNRLWQTTLYV